MQNNHQLTQKKHSLLGIASVGIGVLLPFLLIFFISSGAVLSTRPGTIGNSILGGLLLTSLTFPVLHLVALILGLIGLFSKKTKKLFPAIGTTLNAILLLAGVLLIFFIATNLTIPVR